jgi:hypothetical protein
MPQTGRMYLCARCRAQVVVCRRCDRGQIYCDRRCAAQSRGAAQRAAGQRYQTSRRGRFAHAARARRYRARCKIVTHQGSVLVPPDDLLSLKAMVPIKVMGDRSVPDPTARYCTRCIARCSGAVRLGFLRHHRLTSPQFGVRPAGWRPPESAPR